MKTNELRQNVIDRIESYTGCNGVWHEWKTRELCKLLGGMNINIEAELLADLYEYLINNDTVI